MASTRQQITAIKRALSQARISTYEAATGTDNNDTPIALELYVWNAQVSGMFLAPLHICEVVVRNAVADAIEAKYGSRWPWSPGFEQSLPSPSAGYNSRQDLFNARRNANTVGKVIPELKFAFWQRMFTSRHDPRIWDLHLLRVMTGLDHTKTVSDLRKGIYDDLEVIRGLRNRIAHHEPIFSRNLDEVFDRAVRLIAYRSQDTADWMMEHHKDRLMDLLSSRPTSAVSLTGKA